MAIEQSVLRSKAVSYITESTFFKNAMFDSIGNKPKKTAFLCHSHKDGELVKGLLQLFKESGVELYVDWQDNLMPDKPNAETARRIQDKIIKCDGFIFLGTHNSKISRWCPWEIGYADSSSKKIYIVSTSKDGITYGNEYLELYPNFDFGKLNGKNYLSKFEPNMHKGQILNENFIF